MMQPYWSIGSRWLRWDPHLHAPGTLRNNQFGNNCGKGARHDISEAKGARHNIEDLALGPLLADPNPKSWLLNSECENLLESDWMRWD